MWYEEGDDTYEDGKLVRYIRIEKVPGQNRIYGRMAEEEKLRIARNNNEMRKYAQQELLKKGLHIEFKGTNKVYGVSKSGRYDETLEEQLAVVTVGTTYDGPYAKHLREAIQTGIVTPYEPPPVQQPVQQPAHQPVPSTSKEPKKEVVTEIRINYKGDHIVFVLYKNPKALTDWDYSSGENTIQIEGTPGEVLTGYFDNERDLWTYLLNVHWLTPKDKNTIYKKFIDMYNRDRHGLQ